MSRYAGDDDEENWVAEEIGGEFEDGEDADDDVEIVAPEIYLSDDEVVSAKPVAKTKKEEPPVAQSNNKRKAESISAPAPAKLAVAPSIDAESDEAEAKRLEKKQKKTEKFKLMKEKRKQKLAEEAEEKAKEVLPTSSTAISSSSKKSATNPIPVKPAKSSTKPSSSSASVSESEQDQLASVLADASPLDDHAIAAVAALLRFAPSEQQAAAFTRLLPAMHRTALEKEMGSLQASHFIALPSRERDATKLHSHVKQFCPEWLKSLAGGNTSLSSSSSSSSASASAKFADLTASPILLVITHNAMRAVDFVKSCQQFKKDDVPIAKLFARHMKVGEQIQQLQGEARRTRVAVGTVNRLLRLLDAGALSLERTRYVVIDMEQTVKRLLIFNMPDARVDFVHLFQKYLEPRVCSGKSKLVLF